MTEMVREGDPIKLIPAPGGGWYYEIQWPNGTTDWGFRLTAWGAVRAYQKLIKNRKNTKDGWDR